jgi:hypothetical protein
MTAGWRHGDDFYPVGGRAAGIAQGEEADAIRLGARLQ